MLDQKIINELIEYTQERVREFSIFPFCAFVVKNGSIISKGFNNSTANFGIATTHGEAVAIRKACQSLISYEDLAGCELYTSCEPCLACFDTCLLVGIKKIAYLASHEDEVAAPFFNNHTFHPTDFQKKHPKKIKLHKVSSNKIILDLFTEMRKKYDL